MIPYFLMRDKTGWNVEWFANDGDAITAAKVDENIIRVERADGHSTTIWTRGLGLAAQ